MKSQIRTFLSFIIMAFSGALISGCVDPYYSGSYGNGSYGGSHGPYYDDHHHGGYGGRYDDDDYRDRERERLRDEREKLEREREKAERERERAEAERERLEAEREEIAKRPKEPEHCPPGFSPSERKCSAEERRRGCRDMRLPGGLGCVDR